MWRCEKNWKKIPQQEIKKIMSIEEYIKLKVNSLCENMSYLYSEYESLLIISSIDKLCFILYSI